MHPVLIIVFAPLVAAIIAGLFNRWIGKTAAKGTVVVGRTAVRGTAAAGRGVARGTVCVATFFRRCARPSP